MSCKRQCIQNVRTRRCVYNEKKIVNKKTWKKTIRKYCRNKGLSYVNTKNKEVSEKSEPSEVSCKCQFSCTCLTLEYSN
ncbi:unnamed protein product [Parnassius mnemosyne]|uniref:Uncharacterized protein n=1 Tax=Parnassius mnemosyne TaxID=213953 RepID=A0AAV1KTQ1_9NEOP